MNTRRTATRRVGKRLRMRELHQNIPQVQVVANDQVPVKPPAMTNGEVRETLFQIAQAITTQAQAITSQAYREVAPRENQHASTAASRSRYFTRMNTLKYFGLKVDKDPQYLLNKFNKILFAMGLITMEKAELATYELKDVAQT